MSNESQLSIPTTQAPLTKVESASNYMAATPVVENVNQPSNNSVELLYDPAKYADATEAAPTVKPEAPVQAVEPSIDAEKERAHKLAQIAKAERKVQAQQKEAEAIIKKAESLKIALDSPDLITALEGLGLKPNEIYRKLTDAALKKAEPVKTPEQLEKEELHAKLKAYEDTQNKLISDLNSEREMAAHANAIATSVAPVIKANIDKYETAIDVFGSADNFINHVYKSMWDEYQSSGQQFSAEQAADLIEEHYEAQAKSALNQFKKLKKYQDYFKNEAEEKAKAEQKASNKPTLSRAEEFANVLAAQKKENPEAYEETVETPTTLTNNMNAYGDTTSIFSESRKKQLADFYKKNKDKY
jgi:hypothetical protein